MNEFAYGINKTCPACGKRFSITCTEQEWGYAYGGRLTCTYHCMRDMERKDRMRGRRPKALDSTQAWFLRKHLRGASFADLAETETAKYLKLTNADAVRRFVYSWSNHHPDEVRMIHERIRIEDQCIARSELSRLVGAKSDTLRDHAERLGIAGVKCGKYVYYTRQEAERIVASFRTVSA